MVPVELKGYLPPEKAAELIGRSDDLPERDFSLRRFVESSCVVVDGVQISRRSLVEYVANKLGGAHFDPRRNLSREDDRKFALLDHVRAEYITADKPAIYFELLSLGQTLLRSPDIRRFMDAGECSTATEVTARQHFGPVDG